jgi:hypothetical protein
LVWEELQGKAFTMGRLEVNRPDSPARAENAAPSRSAAKRANALADVRALLGWLIAVLAEPTGGRVVAGLVGDLQHDPVLAEGYHRDVVPVRREAMLAALERGRARGEIRADADLELAVDALHGAVFYRLLLSGEPLDDAFAERLASQVLAGLAA